MWERTNIRIRKNTAVVCLHVASGNGNSLVTLPDGLADAQVRARARDCCSKQSNSSPPHLLATAVAKDLFREERVCWGFLCGVLAARQQAFSEEVTRGLRLPLCLRLDFLVPPMSHFELGMGGGRTVCVCMLNCLMG